MKRVIVTGAAGFVGANLARRLLRENHDVHLIVREETDCWRIAQIRGDVRVHRADLVDRDAITRVVRDIRPEWIFHLATHGASSWQSDVDRVIQANIIGTVNLVSACLSVGFEALVNTGSSSEYGLKSEAPRETDWLEPNSHYALTKAYATMFCRHTAQVENVHVPTLRLYSVYGPYENPVRFIPTLIVNGLEGKLPRLVNPDVARDFVYIDDVMDAYLAAAGVPNQTPGAIYNIGTGIQTTIREAVNVARKSLVIAAEPQWGSMPNRIWDTGTWCADIGKARRELDWYPKYDFQAGLDATIAWFRSDSAMLAFYRGIIPQP